METSHRHVTILLVKQPACVCPVGIRISLHLSLSLSSSHRPFYFISHHPRLSGFAVPPRRLLDALLFLTSDRGADTGRDFLGRHPCFALRQRQHTQTSHTSTHCKAHEKCMHTWTAAYCTPHSIYRTV